jgi:hypothetical protein
MARPKIEPASCSDPIGERDSPQELEISARCHPPGTSDETLYLAANAWAPASPARLARLCAEQHGGDFPLSAPRVSASNARSMRIQRLARTSRE